VSITYSRTTARTLFGLLAAIGLVFSLFAIATPALADHDEDALHVQQETPIWAGDFQQGSEDDCDDLAAGDSRWHFIATNAPESAYAEVTAWFGDGTSQTVTGVETGGAIHFTFDSDSDELTDAWVIFYDESDQPVAFSTLPPETRLVLSHTCAGTPDESPSPEESVEASVEESVEASVEESVEASVEESVEASVEESVEASVEESVEASASATGGVEGGNPTPGGGTVPDTAFGSTSVPAWPFAVLALMSLGGLLYLRLSAEPRRR
jgi:hypothetical protein